MKRYIGNLKRISGTVAIPKKNTPYFLYSPHSIAVLAIVSASSSFLLSGAGGEFNVCYSTETNSIGVFTKKTSISISFYSTKVSSIMSYGVKISCTSTNTVIGYMAICDGGFTTFGLIETSAIDSGGGAIM